MYIEGLKLVNFRNYESLKIEFEGNFNIIYGDNAQGKTNILESVFICASGRSHRTNRDSDIIRFGQKGYYIKLELRKGESLSTIDIAYDKDEKKKIKINDIPVKKIGNLMGNLNAIMFSPEDLQIIKEGPSERRRFLDITISQIKPYYFYDLQQYFKILAQRNSLLKEIKNNRHLIDTLEVWNNNLVKVGSRLIKVRNEFINKMAGIVESNHRKLTNGEEKLSIKYSPSIYLGRRNSIEEIERTFKETLDKAYNSEISKCTTLFGPQRDDYDIFLNDKSIKLYGSQGQQRTAVLSLKLSEIDIMRIETGEYPVLLLDDVMSELDSKRQQYIFENIKDVQTFITTTDRGILDNKKINKSKLFYIKEGRVEKQDVVTVEDSLLE